MPIEVTRTYKLFTFEELLALEKEEKIPGRAMDKVRQWLQDAATEDQWWKYQDELWTDALKQIGFDNPEISFSGFGSQGDGASFTADVDVEKMLDFLANAGQPVDFIGQTDDGKEDFANWIRFKFPTGDVPAYRKLLEFADEIQFEVVRTDSHYSHEYTCRVEWYYSGPEEHQDLVSEFYQHVENLRKRLSQEIYQMLEEEYYSRQEDENLQSLAEANDWTFTIEGKFEPKPEE